MSEDDARRLERAAIDGNLRTVDQLLATVDRKRDRKALDAALLQAGPIAQSAALQ